MKTRIRLLAPVLLSAAVLSSYADDDLECLGAARLAPPAGPESSSYRKYAPNRQMTVLHLALDVTPDFRRRTITAQASLQFKPIAKPMQELRLDAIDLAVTNITATEKIASWKVADENVIVTFEQPIPPDREATVTIRYSAQPKQGLYFRTPEMGYKAEDEHLWTQGEEVEARHWYPCPDSPNQKFTSDVTCRVPDDMVVLSNGRKVSEEKSNGQLVVRWSQDKPHATYLISLVAGHFKKLEDRYRDIPLAFWTVPSDINEAATSFEGTKDMMAFYEQEIGVPYPWAKYDQVCVQDFTAGGMENTSITTLRSETLFTPATENIRSSQSLVAHEMAHQWFGDLVTCKDWSHIWLNEGFATYYAALYDGQKNGRDQFLYNMFMSARTFINQTNDARSIVYRQYGQPRELFDFHAYAKGGWVLHMLRSQLGADLYRRCIKTYLERHQFGNVVTEDLNEVIEELSGRSFDQFFDQWVYHARQPELDVDYAWDESLRAVRITIRQAQPVNDAVVLFHFPLTVRFKSRGTVVDHEIQVKERSEDFYFQSPEAPEIVRIDPEETVLAKINFRTPNAMLAAQLADKGDVIGRLLAVEQLQSRKDHEAIARLKERLNTDDFYGVRVGASQALRIIHTDEALDTLVASATQPDARVRRQVVMDIGGFYRDSVATALARVVNSEKNPDIVAAALEGLGPYSKPEVREMLLKNLHSQSYHEVLADAAIRAMRTQDDPVFVASLLETVPARATDFTSRTFAAGLDTMGFLAREQSNKDAVRELLERNTSHARDTVRLAAITALGRLEDPRAVPILNTFASAAKESPERSAAERALEMIRNRERASTGLSEVRRQLLELQQEDRALRKDLETLQKKLEVQTPTATKPQTKPAKAKKGG